MQFSTPCWLEVRGEVGVAVGTLLKPSMGMLAEPSVGTLDGLAVEWSEQLLSYRTRPHARTSPPSHAVRQYERALLLLLLTPNPEE